MPILAQVEKRGEHSGCLKRLRQTACATQKLVQRMPSFESTCGHNTDHHPLFRHTHDLLLSSFPFQRSILFPQPQLLPQLFHQLIRLAFGRDIGGHGELAEEET